MATVAHQISATQAAREIAAGRLTSEALVRACLSRITEREAHVQAWAFLDPERAIAQARACDRGPRRGPLHGVPIGVKDVIDTADMPTAYNSPIYANHQPRADAACVAAVRRAGAVIMGKTETTEFANNHPARTRNPHNLGHTPGGSSSGSAAAVADFMVPLAFGTQTGGSTIRPSAFCGVVGYKPTFNTINRAGLKIVAESLDTIGLHARTVEDVALLATAASGRPMPEFGRRGVTPRVGLYRTPHWDKTDEATRNLIARVDVYLSYFRPRGLGNMYVTARRIGRPVPTLVVNSSAETASQGRQFVFDGLPPDPRSVYVEVAAGHGDAPEAARDEVSRFLDAMRESA